MQVYKHSFAEYLPLKFILIKSDKNDTIVNITTIPINITELNNRTDYEGQSSHLCASLELLSPLLPLPCISFSVTF